MNRDTLFRGDSDSVYVNIPSELYLSRGADILREYPAICTGARGPTKPIIRVNNVKVRHAVSEVGRGVKRGVVGLWPGQKREEPRT